MVTDEKIQASPDCQRKDARKGLGACRALQLLSVRWETAQGRAAEF